MPPCLLSPELHPMRVNAVRQSSFLFAAHLETLRAPRDVSDTSSRDEGAQMTPCIGGHVSRARFSEERLSVELDGLASCKFFVDRTYTYRVRKRRNTS